MRQRRVRRGGVAAAARGQGGRRHGRCEHDSASVHTDLPSTCPWTAPVQIRLINNYFQTEALERSVPVYHISNNGYRYPVVINGLYTHVCVCVDWLAGHTRVYRRGAGWGITTESHCGTLSTDHSDSCQRQ